MTAGRVLVTGASGFVGRAVCGELMRRGWQVRAAVREAARTPQGCEAAVVGDIVGADWRTALSGVDAVVHLAARVHELTNAGSEAAYDAVNAEATEALAMAAARTGVGRLVFMSTVKVHGERTPTGKPFRAGDEPRPEDAYGRSKWRAEQALTAVSARAFLPVTIVRPPLVYGPGVGANFLRLVRLVASGLPLPFGSVDNCRSLIYVGNLASLVSDCVSAAEAAGRTLLASDGDDVGTPELVRRIGAALGMRVRLVPVPVSLLQAAAAAAGRRAELSRLVQSLAIDIGETRRVLGWHPPFTMHQGLAETVRWYRTLPERD